ncbi:hypothetical protein IMSAG049_00152 [Clostridiales bacterium]|nr:hypothetical protein IMSAG049_00152 [Clostridiales bacterium]
MAIISNFPNLNPVTLESLNAASASHTHTEMSVPFPLPLKFQVKQVN